MDNGFERTEVYDTGNLGIYLWIVSPMCSTPLLKHVRGERRLVALTPDRQHVLMVGDEEEMYEELLVHDKELDYNDTWQVQSEDTVDNFIFLEIWKNKDETEVFDENKVYEIL